MTMSSPPGPIQSAPGSPLRPERPDVAALKKLRRNMAWAQLVFTLAMSILLLFAYTIQIPTALNETTGLLSVERIGKNYYTVVTHNGEPLLLTCMDHLGGYSGCLTDEEALHYAGQIVVVSWTRIWLAPLVETNRLVILKNVDTEVISRHQTLARIQHTRSGLLWLTAGLFAVVSTVLWLMYRTAKRKVSSAH